MKSERRVLILGSEGQDGTLLKELLLPTGDQVVGISRRSSELDLLNFNSVLSFVKSYQPTHIYYLAAYHHSSEDRKPPCDELVKRSFEIHVFGLNYILEAMKCASPASKLVYAASSLVFGTANPAACGARPRIPPGIRFDETCEFRPLQIYGISKATGIMSCRTYRREHSLFASSAILFNHESYLRGPQFITKKTVSAAVAIYMGKQKGLEIGNLDAQVDWSDARDAVSGMQCILECPSSDDFVIASGKLHSVREFAEVAFAAVGLNYRDHVTTTPGVLSRNNVALCGDASKLKRKSSWMPKITFEQMVKDMVAHELANPATSSR